jgi:hypothetical protein
VLCVSVFLAEFKQSLYFLFPYNQKSPLGIFAC